MERQLVDDTPKLLQWNGSYSAYPSYSLLPPSRPASQHARPLLPPSAAPALAALLALACSTSTGTSTCTSTCTSGCGCGCLCGEARLLGELGDARVEQGHDLAASVSAGLVLVLVCSLGAQGGVSVVVNQVHVCLGVAPQVRAL